MEQKSNPNSQLSEYVRAFQNGNEDAFVQIYAATNKYVYYTILKSVQDKDLAEDILQDTFLEIFKNLATLRDPSVFLILGWYHCAE